KRARSCLVLSLITSTFTWTESLYAQVSGLISRVGDATHLEFKGLTQWNYELKKNADGTLSLIAPAFDEKLELALKTWSDQLVSKVEIKKGAYDSRYEVVFHLTDSQVESFDYLTDDPSRLIVDFFK